jgi:hypothetical protein
LCKSTTFFLITQINFKKRYFLQINSELPSGSERDFSHPQSGSAHLAGDGRSCLIVPNFIYQIIEQHLRFQGTLQTARFDFIDYKTYLIVEIVQNLS